MAWDKAQAQAATQAAADELREMLNNMAADQRQGIEALAEWWRKWYNGASGQHPTGHKALGRLLVNGN